MPTFGLDLDFRLSFEDDFVPITGCNHCKAKTPTGFGTLARRRSWPSSVVVAELSVQPWTASQIADKKRMPTQIAADFVGDNFQTPSLTPPFVVAVAGHH